MKIASPILAQVEHKIGDLEGLGPLGIDPQRSDMKASSLISNLIGILTIVAIIYFAFQVILAGYKLLTSSGDKNKASEAQLQITQGVIGIVVIIAAVFIVALVGKLLGIENVLNIETWINKLAI